MCKQMFFTNVSKLNTNKLKKVLTVANEYLANHERDGFGWVAVNSDNSLVGERYVSPKTFQFRVNKSVLVAPFVNKTKSNYFGKLKTLKGPLLIHGRTSTNNVSLINTHPFLKHNWALVHNGVVTNDGPKYEQVSSCDSEHLIELMASTSSIQAIEEHISGYYAFGAIDPQRRLHIVKDDIANLWCTYVKYIDSFIFATTKELIELTCKEMKWKSTTIEEFTDNTYLIFKGNDLLSQHTIKPKGNTRYTSHYMQQSLGYNREYNDYNDHAYSRNYYDEMDWDHAKKPDNATTTIMDKIDTEDDEHALIDLVVQGELTILQFDSTEIDLEDFKLLTLEEKMKCTLIDKNGDWHTFKDDSSI